MCTWYIACVHILGSCHNTSLVCMFLCVTVGMKARDLDDAPTLLLDTLR